MTAFKPHGLRIARARRLLARCITAKAPSTLPYTAFGQRVSYQGIRFYKVCILHLSRCEQ
jgi:hypothetical protein